MALEIKNLQRLSVGGVYVSPERICRTADGELVSEDDPRAAFLVVGRGGSLPRAEAEMYGLIGREDGSAPKALSSLNVQELKELAQAHSVEVPDSPKKAVLEALQKAGVSPATPLPGLAEEDEYSSEGEE